MATMKPRRVVPQVIWMAKRLKDSWLWPLSGSYTATEVREKVMKAWPYYTWKKLYRQGWRTVKVELKELS